MAAVQRSLFVMADGVTSIKIVFLGDSGVGKTSIVTRYVTGSAPTVHAPTVGAAFGAKDLEVDGTVYQLLIWDTAGQELFRGLAPMYYRSAKVAIVVFDVGIRNSFVAVEYWISELRDNCDDNIRLIICGNKIDRSEREIDREFAESEAARLGALYTETSAETGVGVNRVFEMAVQEVMKVTYDDVKDSAVLSHREPGTCC